MNPKRDDRRSAKAGVQKTDTACYWIEAKGHDTGALGSVSCKPQDKSLMRMPIQLLLLLLL